GLADRRCRRRIRRERRNRGLSQARERCSARRPDSTGPAWRAGDHPGLHHALDPHLSSARADARPRNPLALRQACRGETVRSFVVGAARSRAMNSSVAESVDKSSELLEVRDVAVHFDGLTAIDGVSFSLSRGDIFGLIGPNGAGKTTLVNVVSGFQAPTRGQVLLDGRDITAWVPQRRGALGLVRTFQAVRLFRDMTVLENIEVAAVG